MSKKKPLLEALKRIGGKLSLNEEYRDPEDNIELVQLWMTSPKITNSERAHICFISYHPKQTITILFNMTS